MCDDTRPFDGAAEAFAAYVGEWLDELAPLIDAAVVLRRQQELMGFSFEVSGLDARDPYLGIVEVGEFLDVKSRTVNQWRFRGRLPEPDLALQATSLWKRSTILRWAGDTGRLSRPALRAEYEQRWEVEPLPYRRGGRIPEPPKHGRQVTSVGQPIPTSSATGSMASPGRCLAGGGDDV